MKTLAGLRLPLRVAVILGAVFAFGPPLVRAAEDHPGRVVFVSKGCALCHEERAVLQAPPLAALQHDRSLVALAAAMWNHAPLMWANLPEPGLKWPRLTPREMAALAVYLNASALKDPPPNLGRGKVLFVEKGCVRCHALEGEGGRVAKDLVRHVRFDSHIAWAAGMWGHAPTMLAVATEKRLEYPRFEPQELADLIGFLRETAKPGWAGS